MGKTRTPALAIVVIAVGVAAALLQETAAQTLHVVGDGLGWIVPPGGAAAYSIWADLQTFTAGDLLMFNFTTGEQDVARVTKEAFDSCNSKNPIWVKTTGPVKFTLDSGGDYYFISTMNKHCTLGQKLAINVIGTSSGPSASPAPAYAPPLPHRATTTYIVGDGMGWIVPPGGAIAYETWAYIKNFIVGDTLVFNFTTGEQDVARVTKEAFDSCNSKNPIWVEAIGPANFTLYSPGKYYFVSTMDRHCALGQKLAITVTGSSSGPSVSPIPTPTYPPPPLHRATTTYVVGDGLGWIVPPGGAVAYETWAYYKNFIVGDTLLFNFTTGEQDVARVTKKAFNSCDSKNPIWIETTGPANFTLGSDGEYYFISTMDGHCALGQKLGINVIDTSGSHGPAPAHAPPSHKPTTPSPSSSATATASSPADAPTTAPPPDSSAPSNAVISFSVAGFMSLAIAFFF
ncbi:uncharacterized protein LOC127794007 [Diospyros lotus]|uniref:uncharacterized protein LOC127794007 n=1 Tax=Diospyros lotus TaxID=55363 RepID=UPI002256E3DB|nr:uncharacterized protein LOC127794007 [Diospyros lotus]